MNESLADTLAALRQPEPQDLTPLESSVPDAPAELLVVLPEQPAAPVAAPVTAVPDLVLDVTCPTCGTAARVNATRRDADGFCAVCDHPLFWAVERLVRSTPADGGDTGLRRLPGTAGRAVLATVDCWSCDEPNAPSNTHCGRCSALLDRGPAPVVVASPAPTVALAVVEPEPDRFWVVLAVFCGLGVLLLVLLLLAEYAPGLLPGV